MEKLLYAVWKHETESGNGFRDRLLNDISPRLIEAGARKLRVNVVDDLVKPAEPLRIIVTRPPADGLIALWVDTAINRKPLEELIQGAAARIAGYLVTESEPILNTKHPARDGERVHGMNSVVFMQKPPRLSYEEWIQIWHGNHTQVAIKTQSTFGYRQNVVVRPITYAGPMYDAIVEENFPEKAMTDGQVFYDAVGDEEKRQRHEKAMIQSCTRFIDFDKLDRLPMSEYVVRS